MKPSQATQAKSQDYASSATLSTQYQQCMELMENQTHIQEDLIELITFYVLTTYTNSS